MAGQSTVEVSVHCVNGNCTMLQRDALAIEEPLEIRLGYEVAGKRTSHSISVTMRTPGVPRDDFELAAGFLFGEGIIRQPSDLMRVFHCGAPLAQSGVRNTVRVDLHAGVAVDLKRLERHFYTTSSCGVCGKTSIEALETIICHPSRADAFMLDAEVIHRLPRALRGAQEVFASTGGLHAAALFDAAGNLTLLREDVGRHNAVDKLVGAQLLAGQMPLKDNMIFVSGRSSFELVQKALVAGVPVLAAVGAPSSLAVELARSAGMTLLGFVRDGRFNIYAGAWRIREAGVDVPAAGTHYVCVEVRR
ncbi:MAG TPA: formate dehydrogenase accessory sulfurtransferase FdhD [Pyrinomonadaceae bacterium]|nr:formate dehydrogenase accessory sulfurtransferase FdhD [Pyrinomonadaceae bacterium]